jgi:hypothetical protein
MTACFDFPANFLSAARGGSLKEFRLKGGRQ